MLEMRFIRENIELVKENLKKRNSDYDLDGLLYLDTKRRELLQEVETLKKERNDSSSLIGKYKIDGIDTAELMSRMQIISGQIKDLDDKLVEINSKQEYMLLTIPNMLDDSTPVGNGEEDNIEIKKWGTPREFSFEPKSHDELGVELGILDFERGSKLGGSRFTVYKGLAAKLERALINFMLDTHTAEHGYNEILTPQLVKKEMMIGTGQLPKFADDAYKIEGEEMYLIPTAEVTLTNLHNGEILQEEELPKYYCGFTACFRKEAGSHGKDVKGLIRQHQFNKVEMVKLVKPETSYEELDKMLEKCRKNTTKIRVTL